LCEKWSHQWNTVEANCRLHTQFLGDLKRCTVNKMYEKKLGTFTQKRSRCWYLLRVKCTPRNRTYKTALEQTCWHAIGEVSPDYFQKQVGNKIDVIYDFKLLHILRSDMSLGLSTFQKTHSFVYLEHARVNLIGDKTKLRFH